MFLIVCVLQSTDNATLQSTDNATIEPTDNATLQSTDNATLQSTDNDTIEPTEIEQEVEFKYFNQEQVEEIRAVCCVCVCAY